MPDLTIFDIILFDYNGVPTLAKFICYSQPDDPRNGIHVKINGEYKFYYSNSIKDLSRLRILDRLYLWLRGVRF